MSIAESKSHDGFMEDIIGNSALCERFCQDIRNDTLSHAYILDGRHGTGKMTIALNIAAAVCCQKRYDTEHTIPCRACESCRKVFSSLTPDVTVIKPEDGKASISKEQIKEIRGKVCFSPIEMPMRIFIICDAHTMTAEAQNALLLTLEEPPEYVLFLLLTENSSALLETVRSRAPIIRVRPLDNASVKEYLLEHSDKARTLMSSSPEELERLIASADGSIGRAEELLNPSEKDHLYRLNELTDEFIKIAGTIGKTPDGCSKMFSMFENTYFKTRENVGEFFNSVTVALRDMLLLRRANNVKLCYFTDTDEASELAQRFTVANLVRYIELCESARLAVTVRNSNIRLTLLKFTADIFLSDIN